MKKYDAIIVIGSMPDTTTWEFPQQVYQCLDEAKYLLQRDYGNCIITSGKWSITIDNTGAKQPDKECDMMADYLIDHGVPKSKILREAKSKDTISNLYYLKSDFFMPRSYSKILFVVADFRIQRLKFICDRILGNQYEYDFEPIAATPSDSYNESATFKKQKEFLEPMQNGDHLWLSDKFYSAHIYDK